MPDLTSLTAGWGASLWRATWQGSIAILIAYVLCRIFPRISPRLQSWIWRLAYLKLIVAFFWSAPLNLPLLPPAPELPIFYAPGEEALSTSDLAISLKPAAEPLFGIATLLKTLLCFWIVGVVWRASMLFRDWLNLARLRQRGK